MHRRFLHLLVCQLFISATLSGQGISLSGSIASEHHALAGATVSLNDGAVVVKSGKDGFFRISPLRAGTYRLLVSFSGYHPYDTSIVVGNESVTLPPIILKHLIRELEVITVTDNAIDRRKNGTALNLEVVDSDFLKRHLGGSLMQSLDRLPGIQTIGIGSGQSKPLIRGMGFNRVVTVEKGIKHEGQQWGADHGLELDQFAAGEVELVKGAASFIYGSDAIGGVIDVKPAAVPPVGSSGGSVDLIGKSNNGLIGTSVNLYHRQKKWFADGRFTWQHYGDFRVPADTVFVYDYAVALNKRFLRNTAGRETALHFHTGYIDEHFQSIFYLSNVHSRSGFFANAHGLEPRRVNTNLHDASARDIMMPEQEVNHLKVINRTRYSTGNHRFALDLGFQHNFRQEFSPYVNHGYMPAVYPDTLAMPANLEREFDKQVYSFSLQDGIKTGRHSVQAGVSSEFQDNGIGGWGFLVPAFKQVTAGAFVYDKFELSNRLIFHGALRYDHTNIRIARYTDWFPSETTQNGATVSEKLVRAEALSRRFNSLVWSLGINYNRHHFTLKANVGKSFRVPIAKELAANGVNYHYFSYEKGNPHLSPEQSYQVDLGLSWEQDGWFVQLSPFYNYFPNYIYLNPTPDHDYYYGAGNQVFAYTQSRVVRYGGEVQFRRRLVRNLHVEVLGEYLYARQLSGEKKGYALPFSPPPSMLLNATWTPAIGKKITNAYFSVDYRITAAQNNIVPPEKKTPGYGIINLQAGAQVPLKRQAMQISVQVQNLLNKRYLDHTSFYRLIEMPEAGRNLILSVKIPIVFNADDHKPDRTK